MFRNSYRQTIYLSTLLRNVCFATVFHRLSVLAALLFFSLAAVAQPVRKLTLEDAGFTEGQVYTLQSGGTNGPWYLGANGSNSITATNSLDNSNTNYQFAFITDANDNTKIYLYNVGQKAYLQKDRSFKTIKTTTSTVEQIYIWQPGNATGTSAFTFSENVTWGHTSSGTSLGYYVLHIGSSSPSINDWSGVGTSNSITATPVNDVTCDIDAARLLLPETLTYESADISTLVAAGTITTDNKVYTLLDEAGNYLSANASGLTSSSINTAAAQQFVFVADPSDATKVYLYSVGQKGFVTSTRALGTGSAAAQLYAFNTNDPHGYSLAFGFSEDWAGGQVVNTGGLTTSSPEMRNRFKLVEAADFSASDLAAAKRRIKDLATTYTYATNAAEMADRGITVNTKVYTIATSAAARGALCVTSSGLGRTTSISTTDPNQQFVFIQDDAGKVYLYNATQEKFLGSNSSGTSSFVSGASSMPIYVYNTNNYDYTFALSFSEAANFHTESGSNNTGTLDFNLTTNQLLINNYSLFDDGNRFKCTEAGDFSEAELAAAKAFLNGYTKTDFATAGITTDTKVYSLIDENGNRLVATKSGISGSTTATAADANAQFVFFTDPSNADNVYLYSVGQGLFITSTRTLGSGSAAMQAGQLYVFNTNDSHGCNLAFGFSSDWTSGQAVYTDGVSTSNPDKNNRFKVEEATTTTYKQQWATSAFKDEYTLSSLQEMGIEVNKVYYITSDVINSNNQHIIVGGSGSEIGWYTQSSGQNLSDLGKQYHNSTHFAFVTDPDDNSKIYLYSVNASKALNNSGGLVARKANVQRIYVYATGNTEFPLAFGFSDSWNAGDAKNLDGSCNNKTAKLISSSTALGTAKRFKLTEIDDASYSLQLARMNLFPPFHYKGASGRAFKSNGMQATAEYHYYYYVTNTTKEYKRSEMNAIDLNLPLLNYLDRNTDGSIRTGIRTNLGYWSQGNNMEPRGYFRWYDYRTDRMPEGGRIGKWEDWSGHTNQLRTLTDDNGNSMGYVMYHFSANNGMYGPAAANVGVYYEIPDSARYAEWSGDVIACDVSRYADYSIPMNADSTGNYTNATQQLDNFVHEPTLSIRYIFHILPAKKLAADIRDALVTNSQTGMHARGEMKTYNDKGMFSWGVYNTASSTMNLRTNLQNVSDYWFYPLTDAGTRHVYHPDNDPTNAITSEGQFGTEVKQAAWIKWRVYNAEKTAWRYITNPDSSSRTINIRMTGTNGALDGANDWHTLADPKTKIANPGTPIAKGNSCYLVGYAVASDGSMCPFFNAELRLTPYYPKNDTQIATDGNDNRTDDYLADHYGSPVVQFTFDNDNDDQDYTEPTNPYDDNNLTKIPAPFATRQYSFVYPQLQAFCSLSYNYVQGNLQKYYPLHGDYSMLKMLGKMRDRTNVKDKSRFGYFLFTDASDESRQLGSQEFEGNLCSGTDLVISAYVANTSTSPGSTQPELRFTLYGVEKDAQNNITSERPLASVCSGQFNNNINGYSTADSYGVWYQVFGIMNLPSDLNVERYTDFRIGIDNFCSNTWGADYAIDDITVYQNPSKLMVIQNPPVCRDKDDSNVLYRLKGGYETLRNGTSERSDGKRYVYYRFCTSDGNAVTGDNFYGTGNNDYGIAEIPASYTNGATLGEEDHGCSLFETTEAGEQMVVLANRHFNLEFSKTYYLSVATKSKTTTDENGNTVYVPDDTDWGKPSDVCSYYSNNFTVVVQNLVINGEENGTALLNIACDKDTTMGYTINAGLTLPDHENGGKITVSTAKFDWFAGSKSDLAAISDLQEALGRFRQDYPKATDPNQLTTTDEETTAQHYTADDKNLLVQYAYNKTSNTDGKLMLTCSSSLSDYPVRVGSYTFTAILTSDELEYGDNTYQLCNDPLEFTIRAAKNGPRLSLGIPGIQYPADETTRAIRIGFPQMRSMGTTGTLRIPITARYFGTGTTAVDEDLLVVNSENVETKEIYISATNDPAINLGGDLKNLRIADVAVTKLVSDSLYLDLCNFNTGLIHEGYWYETSVTFVVTESGATSSGGSGSGNGSNVTVNCPGETFFRIKVVPEYLTWAPTADNGLSSNWNNDLNWRRSTAAELFKPDYTDYSEATYKFDLYDSEGKVAVKGKTNPVDAAESLRNSTQPQSYTPMYFSKVTIPTLTTQPYPMLGFIRRNATTGLVQRMTNGKASAPTTNIEYDMMAMATETAKGSTTDSIYKCSVFDGNVCEQIWFKTGAQLRAEQYLRYGRAWCELELPVNSWGTFTSPMASTFAGEMYLTKYSARQETEGFREIRFDDKDEVYLDEQGNATYDSSKKASGSPTYGLFGKAEAGLYNRLRMPTYQMSWGTNEEEVTEDGNYGAHDNPTQMLIYPSVEGGDDMSGIDLKDRESYTLRRNAWSHVFNDMSLKYQPCVGMAGKIGDDYATPTGEGKAWNGKSALMRLPKSDDQYVYYKRDGNGSTAANITAAGAKATDHYRLAVGYDNTEGSLGQMQHRTYSVMPYPQVKQDDEGYTYDYSNANQYVLMANPYTATISVQRFVEANQNELAKVDRDGQKVYRVWTYYNNVLYELAPDGVSGIAPGQAFFIRVETPGRGTVTFTERMQIDPNISSGSTVEAAARAPKRITYTVKSADEVTKALSAIDAAGDVQMWSPREGWVAVSGATDLRIGVYSTDGAQIHTAQSSAGATKQLYTGKGIFVVRATTPDGKTIARKLAVK